MSDPVDSCPHPEKHRHATQAAALLAQASLERSRGIDLSLAPYPCGDHWHLGHRKKRRTAALRRALADGRRNARTARKARPR
ncbi:hypothetical protein [Pimelobacter simplex]|uniref:hypothetical protein n=1 Tax=Nocardioides simplex TaxID=2045 RepID=UPI00214FB361|nr:hypothetical protein [Pimelobacter simplex]UUW88382.1 hypothetical protein M0M43_21920 [Pimelobacter simplex]UUW97886.1 hypothetical protein M0M48_10565 [Pimelobacter simplex]